MFIRIRWGHSVAPWVSLGSFWFLAFIHPRPAGRRMHLGSFGSLGRTLDVVGIIQARSRGPLGSFGPAVGIVGFIRVRWVHSSTH